jgi:hypothetical protein
MSGEVLKRLRKQKMAVLIVIIVVRHLCNLVGSYMFCTGRRR